MLDQTPRSNRKPRERRMTGIAPLETIRNRLGLDMSQFSEALGYKRGTYAQWVAAGFAPTCAALGAECLARRNGQETKRKAVLVTFDQAGRPRAQDLDAPRELLLDGQVYWLVPQAAARE